MDAKIIRDLLKCRSLKCNLTYEESRPIHLEEEDLAEGIVECGTSAFAKVLSLKEGFISNQNFTMTMCGLLGHWVKQCPTLLKGADPWRNLAYDVWIEELSEKSWIIFKLEEDLTPSEDIQSLGGGPSRLKISDNGVTSLGDGDCPTYPPDFGPLRIDSEQQDGSKGVIKSIQSAEASSPKGKDKIPAYHQHSLKGNDNVLGYSKGATTLQQDFRKELNRESLSPPLNETFKMETLNENLSNEIIISETVTDQSEEPDLSPTLQYFHYQNAKTQIPINTGRQSTIYPKCNSLDAGPDRVRNPSKKRFHPYVEASSNGSQSKKPSLSIPGLDGSEALLKSAKAAEQPSRP
ncbi:hypothetical protein LIER_00885 [Lithospermum erythrorhizon]|uniref:Zinc knuckle CX2CX4HX4C domain-containing protein n=1 Tax=Lithospermum erythrorhizon TaxID=34254 RepID=A0AAV3NIZ5_LITER